MAEEGIIPPWVQFVIEQMDRRFIEVREDIAKLVTRDAFAQEQGRVNEKFEAQDKAMSDLSSALKAEATARVASEQALAKERNEERQEKERDASTRRWMVLGMIATPIISIVLGWVAAGGLASVGGP